VRLHSRHPSAESRLLGGFTPLLSPFPCTRAGAPRNGEGSPQSGHHLSRLSCAAMFISSRCASQTSLPRRTGTSQPSQPHATIELGVSRCSGSAVMLSSLSLSALMACVHSK
jgi:hypothetical protein